eukprot:scaffold10926_cov163-Amphora_coffeaeformis.AAC.11
MTIKYQTVLSEKASPGEGGAGEQTQDEPVITASAVNEEGFSAVKGEVQPPEFRDVPFAILFFVHLLGISGAAFMYGSAVFHATDEDTSNNNYDGNNNNNANGTADEDDLSSGQLVWVLTSMFMIAAVCTMASLRIMIKYPMRIIQIAFFAAPVLFGAVALLMTAVAATSTADSGDVVYQYFWIVAAVAAAISVCYYQCFRRYIPFATTTLKTALTALRGHLALYLLEFGLTLVLYAYTALWLFVFGGVYAHDHLKGQAPCQQVHANDDAVDYNASDMCDTNPISMPVVFLFFVCLYWTQQVVQNLMHTTTSVSEIVERENANVFCVWVGWKTEDTHTGVVGSWWFAPADAYDPSCCGRDVSDSFARAATYSFGSICFGSLLVSLLQALERLSRRRERDIVTLVVTCLVACLRAWLEYFNSWAFCYVGLYGYDYLSAGRNVVQLFKTRGWTTFIADRLVFRVLFLANIGVAVLTGFVCLFATWIMGAGDSLTLHIVFWVSFVIGLLVSQTILFVVESATRTTMVLFAESTTEFAEIHGELYEDLKGGWSATYPDAWSRAAPVVTATPLV